MAETATTSAASPSWGDTLMNLLNKGVDTAAAYGSAKLQADATRKANESAYRSDMAAANAAAAGSKTGTGSGGLSSLPKWVAPVAMGLGALLVVGLVWKLVRGK